MDVQSGMSNYQFSQSERWAVWIVHGDVCYLCDKPINYTDMQVDHVVPEHLLDDPERLAEVLTDYGLDAGFDLNAPENWLPSHGPCNRKKSGSTFNSAPILLVQLKRASEKAAAVRAEIIKGVSDRRIGNALAVLETATESGDLKPETLIPLVQRFLALHPSARAALRLMDAGEDGGLARLTLGYAFDPPPPPILRLTRFAQVAVVQGGVVLLTMPNSANS